MNTDVKTDRQTDQCIFVQILSMFSQANLCHPCADVAFGVFARDLGAKVVEVRPVLHVLCPT